MKQSSPFKTSYNLSFCEQWKAIKIKINLFTYQEYASLQVKEGFIKLFAKYQSQLSYAYLFKAQLSG